MVTLLYKLCSLAHGFKQEGQEQNPGAGQKSPRLLSKFPGTVPVHQAHWYFGVAYPAKENTEKKKIQTFPL